MLLQALEGLSDRDACDQLEVDLRWQAAAGVDAGYRASRDAGDELPAQELVMSRQRCSGSNALPSARS